MAEMEGVGQGLSHGIQSFTNTALALGNAEQHALDTREQQKVQQGFLGIAQAEDKRKEESFKFQKEKLEKEKAADEKLIPLSTTAGWGTNKNMETNLRNFAGPRGELKTIGGIEYITQGGKKAYQDNMASNLKAHADFTASVEQDQLASFDAKNKELQELLSSGKREDDKKVQVLRQETTKLASSVAVTEKRKTQLNKMVMAQQIQGWQKKDAEGNSEWDNMAPEAKRAATLATKTGDIEGFKKIEQEQIKLRVAEEATTRALSKPEKPVSPTEAELLSGIKGTPEQRKNLIGGKAEIRKAGGTVGQDAPPGAPEMGFGEIAKKLGYNEKAMMNLLLKKIDDPGYNPFGRYRGQSGQRIMFDNAFGAMLEKNGIDPKQVATASKDVKADTKAYLQLNTDYERTMQAVEMTKQYATLVHDRNNAYQRSGYPAPNRFYNWAQKNLSSQELAQFEMSLMAFSREYMRVTTGAARSVAELSVGAQAKVDDILSKFDSWQVMNARVSQAEKEINAVPESYQRRIGAIKGRLDKAYGMVGGGGGSPEITTGGMVIDPSKVKKGW